MKKNQWSNNLFFKDYRWVVILFMMLFLLHEYGNAFLQSFGDTGGRTSIIVITLLNIFLLIRMHQLISLLKKNYYAKL